MRHDNLNNEYLIIDSIEKNNHHSSYKLGKAFILIIALKHLTDKMIQHETEKS